MKMIPLIYPPPRIEFSNEIAQKTYEPDSLQTTCINKIQTVSNKNKHFYDEQFIPDHLQKLLKRGRFPMRFKKKKTGQEYVTN